MPHEDDFITVADAATLAGQCRGTGPISQATVRRWMDDPSVPVHKYRSGGRVWLNRNEITAYATPQLVAPAELGQ